MTSSGLLSSFRVVSLALNVPGPVACAELTRLGASVLKLEPPSGDPLETFSPTWYRQLSEGQEIVRRDLKSEAGREVLERALTSADLVLTSMRPGALQRASLDWPALTNRHPHISLLTIFGHDAPHQARAGHDLTYQAAAGLLDPPRLPTTLLADLAAAGEVVNTAMRLLWSSERGEAAAWQEVGIQRVTERFAAPIRHGLTAPGGQLAGGDPLYGCYETASGWIAVAALEPHFRVRLLGGLNCAGSPRELREAFRQRTAAEWESWAIQHDLPISALRR